MPVSKFAQLIFSEKAQDRWKITEEIRHAGILLTVLNTFLCLDLFMNKRLTGVLSSGHPRIRLSHFWRKLLHEFNLRLEVLDDFECMKNKSKGLNLFNRILS